MVALFWVSLAVGAPLPYNRRMTVEGVVLEQAPWASVLHDGVEPRRLNDPPLSDAAVFDILEQLYQGLNGDTWLDRTNWGNR